MHMQMSFMTSVPATNLTGMETIATRFGDVTVDLGKAVVFPRGLLGMPDKMRFVATNFPSEKMKQFRLLQSLDDHNLSFITLPLEVQNSIIAPQDVRSACQDLQIPEEDMVLLLIVSVHRGLDSVRLSVNARAPLLLDVERRLGAQFVFQNDAYSVQHMLG